MTNGPPNPEQALRAVRAAKEALDAAIQLTEQRQHQLATDIKTAKALLGEVIKAENTLGPTAPPQLTVAGLDKSAAALNASCDLLSTAGLESKVGSSIDEWKECRTTIDRFDKILVDLRKTGFGFITAVV